MKVEKTKKEGGVGCQFIKIKNIENNIRNNYSSHKKYSEN